ncbi:unnamed protein product [Malus baccata var. baccata]
MIKTFDDPHPSFLSNHLVNMYSKLDLLDTAQLVLQLNPSRSVVTWISLVASSVQNDYFASAFLYFAFKASGLLRLYVIRKQLHALAVKAGQICDVFVGCSAFDMYNKTGLRDEARKMFDEIPNRNLATWNAYMSNAVLDGHPLSAVYKFIEFLWVDGEPDSITFCAFLNACSDMLNLELRRQLHGFVMRCGFGKDVSILNRLRNDVSWCSMVAACVQNDEEEKACDVLSACAGVVWIEQGRSVHAVAVKACVEGNVFVGSALVDMYGKYESIEDAHRAFDELPLWNLITWSAMVSAYAHQGHADIALALFEEMCWGPGKWGCRFFESMKAKYGIEPGAGHYTCVVDLLGQAGMVERASEFIPKMPISTLVRKKMMDVGIKKGAGYSWIAVKNAVHVFQAKDTSHERNLEIQAMLTELRRKMDEAGYIADTNFALFDLEKEKVSEVWYLEKIALAFGLISIPPGVPIRITKNLRICGDFHGAIKFVSSIIGREIIEKGIQTSERRINDGTLLQQVFFFDIDEVGP